MSLIQHISAFSHSGRYSPDLEAVGEVVDTPADREGCIEGINSSVGLQACLDERSRLARELHDTVSQTLYGLALGARTARDHLIRSPDRAREPVEYVLAMADRALFELRAAILDLQPDVLVHAGFTAALRHLTDDARLPGGPDIYAVISELPPLDEAVQVALYRIAAEALHNACKHARAGLIQLRYGPCLESVALDIIDNGVGFEPDRDQPGHFGLASMRERALRVGGDLMVHSHVTQGTHVRITVPRASVQ